MWPRDESGRFLPLNDDGTDRGAPARYGSLVGFASEHPIDGAVVQYGHIVELVDVDAGDGPEPGAVIAWVTGGQSGPIPVSQLVEYDEVG